MWGPEGAEAECARAEKWKFAGGPGSGVYLVGRVCVCVCVCVEGGVLEGGGEAERRKPSMIPITQEESI